MAGEDKLFVNICGKPVLAHTLETFQNCSLISEIVVVAREDMLTRVSHQCGIYSFDKVTAVILGGATRLDSVLNGTLAVPKENRLIAIHDGARPCVDQAIIEKAVIAAACFHAAAPAVQVSSTVKRVKKGVVTETIDRSCLFEIQTPQVFETAIIKAALTYASEKGVDVTDDCMAAELIGVPVHITDGARNNIKITTNEDIVIAEAIIRGRGTISGGHDNKIEITGSVL